MMCQCRFTDCNKTSFTTWVQGVAVEEAVLIWGKENMGAPGLGDFAMNLNCS